MVAVTEGVGGMQQPADRELLVTDSTLHVRLADYAMISTMAGR